jgi:hypothetical protein
MHRRPGIIAVLVVAGLMPSVAGHTQSVRLRYYYQPGEELRYEVKLNGNGTINAPILGRNDPMDMTGRMIYSQKVQSVDAQGNATVQMTVQDWNVNATWGLDVLPVALNLPPLTMKVTPSGKVLSTEVGRAAPGTGADLSGWVGNEALGMDPTFDFAKFFGATRNIGFPLTPVSVGESWEDRTTVALPDGGQLQIDSTSRLVAFKTFAEQPCAQIETTFKVPLNVALSQLGIPFKLEGTESGRLTNYFAYQQGRMLSTSGAVDAQVTMSGSVDLGGGRSQDVAVSMASRTNVQVKLQ